MVYKMVRTIRVWYKYAYGTEHSYTSQPPCEAESEIAEIGEIAEVTVISKSRTRFWEMVDPCFLPYINFECVIYKINDVILHHTH